MLYNLNILKGSQVAKLSRSRYRPSAKKNQPHFLVRLTAYREYVPPCGLFLLQLCLQLGQTGDVAQSGLLDRSLNLLDRRLGSLGSSLLLGLVGSSLCTLCIVEDAGVRKGDALGCLGELDKIEIGCLEIVNGEKQQEVSVEWKFTY